MTLLAVLPVLGLVRSLSRFEGAGRPWDLMTIEQHLDEVVPQRQALIVAAGDDSPSIYLYYMHRKGWAVAEKLSENELTEMKSHGAKYFVSSSRLLEKQEDLAKHLVQISEHGSFRVFALQE